MRAFISEDNEGRHLLIHKDKLTEYMISNKYQPAVIFITSLLALALLFWVADPALIVNGILLGFVFALGAIGLSLIYGILKFAHMAHGDFMTFGAYLAFFVVSTIFGNKIIDSDGIGPFTFDYPILIAIPISMIIVGLVSVLLDFVIYRRLRMKRSNVVVMSMASLGVAIALRAVVRMLWGTQPEHYPRVSKMFYQLPLEIRIPPDNIFVAAISIILVIGLYFFLKKTRAGKAMRATSDNPDLAKACGINTERVVQGTWFLGSAMAATAGVLLAISQAQLLPFMGWKLIIPLFAAVILGGIGSPMGALIGALIVGLAMEVSTGFISPAYKPAIAFLILLLVLIVRPQGIIKSCN